ncbi:bifunctional UDP-N-acetylglucosamine diphosphorylase/glucosamine-1-phosphate N-acetyltransferase GlmU [Reinekea sp.]|jgi:bifunctional UDP-N-acetylglucosamine pyrophosphorylase/glucosamine-1-phosphate N-acetyltransferase|uniref:bifunctional UDP-N-acetylglucosamine diphosphorylase/glucosamine-1-phosphate N-acetyltransferase GlmU n=1 Tax=Reinekea sp. TaxID=1970455 RepID=UPI002A817B4A|nr:bifunctional UDP-N-acetylglucosamine diphosphorylase/glucosamine-1-phosphate N-acetyltransferase GlmU [Reinekea sp.]
MDVSIVVLAAGQGSRMKSSLPKVLHYLAGQPLAAHVVNVARQFTPDISLVIGHGAEQVRQYFAGQPLKFCVQTEQLGTGHAVSQALPLLPKEGAVLILYGDVPLTRADTLQRLIDQVTDKSMGLLTVKLEDPSGYGRIVRDAAGQVTSIVEHKDALPEQLAINEINSGIIALPAWALHDWLPSLSNQNAQGEYYLTDLIAIAVGKGVVVNTVQPSFEEETLGVNNRVQLAQLERWHQQQIATELMTQGVTLMDPARIDVRGSLLAGQDCLIDVNCLFEGTVTLANNVTIGPNCVLRNATIGTGTVIEANTLIDGASVGASAQVGPFARLRPGTELADYTKIGNFVETKKAIIGVGSKVNHLSYIGDTVIGTGSNIGAGTISCNYDGVNKYATEIGNNAFVGSNSTLVAPVVIRDGAFVGAGSVITKTAPADQLTLGRSRQVTIAKWQKPVKQ